MRRIAFVISLIFSLHLLNAQVIYFSAEYALYKLDLAACTYTYEFSLPMQITDLAFHPDGTLYGIDGEGEIFIIDPNTGEHWIIHNFPDIGPYTSLVAGANGIIYAANDKLSSYNKWNDQGTLHGNLPLQASGDLTFQDGNLYVATVENKIMLVNIADPPSSYEVMEAQIPGEIWGIFSYAENCEDVNSYAISSGNSVIYLIDFDAKTLEPVCQLDIEVWGGGSTYEFYGSNPVYIDTLIQTNPECNLQNGSITMEAHGGIGQLTYSLNGGSFQSNNTFNNLTGGTYTIVVQDKNGCSITREILLPDPNPAITQISVEPALCGEDNGAVNVEVSGGTGLIEYSIDQVNYQLSPLFENLSPGIYSIFIRDAAGCSSTANTEVYSVSSSQIENVLATSGKCEVNEGSAIIVTNGLNIQYSLDGVLFQTDNHFDHLLPGQYTVTAEDENGCTDTASFEILPAIPLVLVQVNQTGFNCQSPIGTLEVIHSGGSGLIQYALNDGAFQSGNQFTNVNAGSHTIVIMDEIGCKDSGTIEIDPAGGMSVENIISHSADCGEKNGTITIHVNGGNGSLTYSLNGGLSQNNGSFNNIPAGAHHISVTDDAGCSIDTIVQVSQLNCEIYIPNTFSPNHDNVNDLFELSTSGNYNITILKYLIFDRWGNLVYSASDFPIQSDEFWWDGSIRRLAAGPGVFAYYIEVEGPDRSRESFKGNVTLVR